MGRGTKRRSPPHIRTLEYINRASTTVQISNLERPRRGFWGLSVRAFWSLSQRGFVLRLSRLTRQLLDDVVWLAGLDGCGRLLTVMTRGEPWSPGKISSVGSRDVTQVGRMAGLVHAFAPPQQLPAEESSSLHGLDTARIVSSTV